MILLWQSFIEGKFIVADIYDECTHEALSTAFQNYLCTSVNGSSSGLCTQPYADLPLIFKSTCCYLDLRQLISIGGFF